MVHVEVRIRETMDSNWQEWFEGFVISYTDQGETILAGTVPDQAALYGLVAKLRDLGLPLVSINSRSSLPPAGATASRVTDYPNTL
jgi:hypothetical protein